MLLVTQNSTKPFNIYFGTSGLTVTATLSKNGGAFNSVSPTITDRSNGFYSITPISAHRDTIGENAWLFAASGQTSVPRVEQVGLTNVDVAAVGAATLADIGAGLESYDTATETNVNNQIASVLAKLPESGRASTLTAQQVWEYIVTGSTSAATALTTLLGRIIGTLASGTHNPQSGDAFARLGAPAGASIAADIAAIEAGGMVTVVPLTGVVEERANGTSLSWFTGETSTQAIAVVDAEGTAVNVEALNIKLCFEKWDKTDLATIANASITKSGSTITFTQPSAVTANEGQYRWSLRTTSTDSVLMQGTVTVTYAASVDV